MKTTMLATLAALALLTSATVRAGDAHTTTQFQGAKANKGTVTHNVDGKKDVLILSSDFKVPGTPAPHWQVVDSHGHTYLLNRLVIKGDKLNQTIVVPEYVPDVVKVQIWCAWAEALLGEASFDKPIAMRGAGSVHTAQTK